MPNKPPLPITTERYLGLAHEFIVRAYAADTTGCLRGTISIGPGEADLVVNLRLEHRSADVEHADCCGSCTRSTLDNIVERVRSASPGVGLMAHSQVFGFGGTRDFSDIDIGPAAAFKDNPSAKKAGWVGDDQRNEATCE